MKKSGLAIWLLAIVCACGGSCGGKKGGAPAGSPNDSKDETGATPSSESKLRSENTDQTGCDLTFSMQALPAACAQSDDYMAVLINGAKSGYAISGRLQTGDRVESCEFSQIVMKRGEISMTIASIVNMVETASGAPVGWQMLSEGSGMQKKSCGVIDGEVAHVSTVTAGTITKKDIPWEAGTLMQEGVRLFMKNQSMEKGATHQAKGFDVESESVMTLDYTVVGRGTVDLLGKVTSGIRIDTTVTQGTSSMKTEEWLTDDLETLKSVSNVMGMQIETVRCEKEYALQNNSPAEIFTTSFIESPQKLNRKMLSNGISYQIAPENGRVLDFPVFKEQETLPISGSSFVRVNVRPMPLPVGGTMPYAGDDAQVRAFLNSNAWIQSTHPEIVSLAKEAIGDETAPDRAAKRIESFVSGYIDNRSLSVGYASALEVLKSRQGDCTEFALLTAALCRAVGIPARVVFGVVYVAADFEGHSHFFGGHAWTQVYIKDGWYSLDAALGGFDAGHIAIDTNDGEPSNFFKLISTMGYFDIIEAKKL
ncbi:MAG: transglutaminase domain-containing protein [Deltaproteobacteria bacterium]|nr:transglutaminase domain-containing protein [Deltaproteobacteria bacterium]